MPAVAVSRGVSSAACGLLLALISAASSATGWVSTESHGLHLNPQLLTSPVPAATPMHLMLSLRLRNPQGLERYIENQHLAGSPLYGSQLSTSQFMAEYAPTPSQVQAVVNYLEAQGFSNIQIEPNRVVISADATAAMAERAFNTRLVAFDLNGHPVHVPVSEVMVPQELGSTVLSVLGLQNAFKMKTHSQFTGPVRTNAGTPAVMDSITVAGFRTAYDAGKTSKGSATTVAISTGGDDLSQVIKDLKTSELPANNNLPGFPVSVIQVAPLANPQDTSGDGEWALDSQASTGMAEQVQRLVFYNATDLGDSVLLAYNRFASDNVAKVGNMSYGGCESVQALLGGAAADNQAFMQAAAQGQTWFASSGDAGAACSYVIPNIVTPDVGVPSNTEFPASSPYVVAVGGSTLVIDSSYNYISELTWDASGGGISLFSDAPAWQMGIVPSAAAGQRGRGVPDIAMHAGGSVAGVPELGAVGIEAADIIIGGDHGGVVGTSLSSPLAVGAWARIQSAHCNGLGFAAPLIYALDASATPASVATGFNDVMAGTNGEYVATPGWDFTTGFGSIDISKVQAALPAAASGCSGPGAFDGTPVAVLTASKSFGASPLLVSFDPGKSSDPDAGDSIGSYSIDFGDGSPVVTSTNGAAVSHSYLKDGNYTARLDVKDSHGVGGLPDYTHIRVAAPTLACTAPGIKVLDDPMGDNADAGVPGHDLYSISVAEPYSATGADKIVFSMDLDSVSQLPPNSDYFIFFGLADGTHFVEYQSTPLPAGTGMLPTVPVLLANPSDPQFLYGHSQADSTSGFIDYVTDGATDAESALDVAHNRIVWVLSKSKIPTLKTGSGPAVIQALSPQVTVLAGVFQLGLNQTLDGATPADYAQIGNAYCNPLNLANAGSGAGSPSTGSGGTGGVSPVTGTPSTANPSVSEGRFGGAMGLGLLPLLPWLGRRRRR